MTTENETADGVMSTGIEQIEPTIESFKEKARDLLLHIETAGASIN
ncbi:hypothetical protein M2171_002572 [Bradyrhizobium japonicum USDA 38]|nr:hypothetical protein [Bradyrhizobium japonicum]MCS3893439.1 hypothetical protein [Bradyrhizobium japonicum USDA 38]MCS3945953.1 hypothetical protein [Bradyrhizobium japonicum]